MKKTGVIKTVCAASLAAAMSITAVAAVFPDTQSHWAKTYISDMNTRGIIQGYTDGTFRPDNSVKTVELLVMLARMCEIDSATKEKIYADYKSSLTATFGTELSWAHDSFAVCIAGNIITEAELSALFKAGSLNKQASKELLSVFLVRAMGLEQRAKDSAGQTLVFVDADKVSQLRRPYVYVLSSIGIVEGNTKNEFEPASDVTRAVTATMISRALAYMGENGISVDFSKYINQKRISGTISDIRLEDNRLSFVITNAVSGTQSASVSTECTFYYDGIKTDISAISDGKYVMILYKDDAAQEVRICSSYREISGVVLSANAKKLELMNSADGTVETFDVSEYTAAVDSSAKQGGAQTVAAAKKFTAVTCAVNTQKQLLYAKFGSEVHSEQVSLENIQSFGEQTTAELCRMNGFCEGITLGSSVYTTADGKQTQLAKAHEGKLATVVYSADKSEIIAVEVNTNTTICRGTLKSVMTDATPKVLYITDADGKVAGYDIMTDEKALEVKYNDSAVSLYKLTNGTYVAARIESGNVAAIYTYSSEASVSGLIESVTYGDSITLKITADDGRKMSFALDATKLPAITRGGSSSTIDKLRAKDSVKITQKNGKITLIAAGTQQADTTGVITAISMEMSGTVLSYKNEKDGQIYTRRVADGADVKKDGRSISISDLKIGYTVALVTDEERIYSVEVTQTSSSTSSISGKVLYINSTENTVLIETSDGTQITVKIPSSANMFSAKEGMALTFKNIKVQDVLTVYGAYDGSMFKATLVIR